MVVIVFSNLSINGDFFHRKNITSNYPDLEMATFYIPYKYEVSSTVHL